MAEWGEYSVSQGSGAAEYAQQERFGAEPETAETAETAKAEK